MEKDEQRWPEKVQAPRQGQGYSEMNPREAEKHRACDFNQAEIEWLGRGLNSSTERGGTSSSAD